MLVSESWDLDENYHLPSGLRYAMGPYSSGEYPCSLHRPHSQLMRAQVPLNVSQGAWAAYLWVTVCRDFPFRDSAQVPVPSRRGFE
jgi:hypothetical protein